MILLLSALLVSAQPPAEPTPAEIHNFKDWVVTCDNGLRCAAVSLVPEQAGEAAEGGPDPWERFGVMRIEREAGPDAPVTITVTDFDGRPARLTHYDENLDVGFAPAEEGAWRIVPRNRDEFIDRMYAGTMAVVDGSGRTLAEFALDGAHGAMLYMDERQGRLHTAAALIRRGKRPAGRVPPPAARPVVTLAPATAERPLELPAARLREIRRETGCLREEVGGEESQSYHALGGGRTLVLLSCGAGAYNFNSLPMIAWREGRQIRTGQARVDVPIEPFEDKPPQFLVTNGDYDPASRHLTSYAKGRGLGDCGISSIYGWDGQGFRLLRQEEMSVCRGTMEMLTTWRVEER